jgi:hypothetical protein
MRNKIIVKVSAYNLFKRKAFVILPSFFIDYEGGEEGVEIVFGWLFVSVQVNFTKERV